MKLGWGANASAVVESKAEPTSGFQLLSPRLSLKSAELEPLYSAAGCQMIMPSAFNKLERWTQHLCD